MGVGVLKGAAPHLQPKDALQVAYTSQGFSPSHTAEEPRSPTAVPSREGSSLGGGLAGLGSCSLQSRVSSVRSSSEISSTLRLVSAEGGRGQRSHMGGGATRPCHPHCPPPPVRILTDLGLDILEVLGRA